MRTKLPASAVAGVAILASSAAAFAVSPFTVRVPGAADGGRFAAAQIYEGFGCTGGNRSPALVWSQPPAGTRSFAVTIFDPDAPTGNGWWHWTVFNLPASLRALPEGAGDAKHPHLPAGAVQGRTDFGTQGYGGPCPPPGDPAHHYVITVWALDVDRLALDEHASGAMVGFTLNQHARGKAVFTLRYGRPKPAG